MLNENLSINVTPGGVPVVIHISQYDVGLRTFVFTPYTSHGTFTPDSAVSATLEGTKPDGNIVVQNCSYNRTTGAITYTVQEQLAAVVGKVWSKLTLRDTSGNAIGYAAIIWVVDMAGVQDGAVASDSDISALQEFIAQFGTINAYRAALNGALAAVGGPYVASTVAQMTDRTKVYVYTGSETGYTAGHWYYWNGSAWTDGGVYQAAAVETDTTLTVAGMAADAKATGDEISELKNDLTYISTTGINLFDKSTAHINKAINLSGDEYNANNFYCSDFIPVEPSTLYRIAVAVGSASAYLTCAFYDANKTFLSGSFNSSITAYTVTTPSDCAYIRINGAVVRIDTQMVSLATGLYSFSNYQRIIDGRNEMGVRLVSAKEIFYNKSTGLLTSGSTMIIATPDNMFNVGTSVNVGTSGGYLYWNKKSGTLYTSGDKANSDDIYQLAVLSDTREFESHKQYCTIDSAFPIFKLDLYNNKLIVEVKGQPCYLIYNGSYYALSSGFRQEITLPTHCVVYYSPEENSFGAMADFSNYALSKGIPVMTRFYTFVTCRVEYETVIYDGSYLRFVCYGDSLTWYDGQAFTWGEHQGETCVGFETYILNDIHARAVANRGASGESTPQICSRITSATDFANYDVMTIMGGDNDDRLDVPVGTVQPVGGTFDTTTVCGALQNAIEYALAQNPTLRIILITEPMGWTYQNGAMDRVSELIPNAYRNVAKQYGLPVIDLWNESGINELNMETYYADPAPSDNQLYMYHPNNDGWVRCSKVIVKRIKELI